MVHPFELMQDEIIPRNSRDRGREHLVWLSNWFQQSTIGFNNEHVIFIEEFVRYTCYLQLREGLWRVLQ